MARGGARPGAGRKVGAITKKTRERAEAIAESDDTPLDSLDELRLWAMDRFRAALADEDFVMASQAAAFAGDIANKQAPFVHPKLSSIDAKVKASVSHEDWLDDLPD